jgi:CelD/BcsL family acetyltransferase involved in cellulose biosynthesis/glycosyltransferase involved in cell wall biosynthesis
VLAQIDRALAKAGHHSIVIAREDSSPSGDLVPLPVFEDELDDSVITRARQRTREAIEHSLRRWKIDIVHMHGIDFCEYLPDSPVPTLVTLHLPPEWYRPDVFALRRPRTYLHCVSRTQQQRCPTGAKLLPPIQNGVPLDAFEPGGAKQDYALALGRICPEKGFHLALEAARAANIPLFVGGEVYKYQSHQRYYESEIVPRLDNQRHFLGPLCRDRKLALLQSARCLLVPSQVSETSSLVAMEALACGTPVVAFPSGALADIVEHGITGFLVNSVQEMASAIERVTTVDAQACRRAAEQHFSIDRTLGRYLDLYDRLSCKNPIISIPSFRRDVLRSTGAVRELEQEYALLFQECPSATPFSSPAWILPWSQHLGSGEVTTVVVRRNGVLAGIAPLAISEGRLQFLGAGESDYMDLLAIDHSTAAALWESILEVAREVDVLELRELREDSIAISTMPENLRIGLEDGCVCPVIELPHLRLPSKQLKNLRAQLRKLPDARFELAEQASVTEFIDAVFGLHTARWHSRQQDGALALESIRRFHRETIPRLLRDGLLRIHGLRVQGRLGGVLYCLARGERVFYYLGGFDPALARYGPGSILIQHAIESARSAGAIEFDMLRGTEPYKYRWGARNRTSRNLVVGQQKLQVTINR